MLPDRRPRLTALLVSVFFLSSFYFGDVLRLLSPRGELNQEALSPFVLLRKSGIFSLVRLSFLDRLGYRFCLAFLFSREAFRRKGYYFLLLQRLFVIPLAPSR